MGAISAFFYYTKKHENNKCVNLNELLNALCSIIVFTFPKIYKQQTAIPRLKFWLLVGSFVAFLIPKKRSELNEIID